MMNTKIINYRLVFEMSSVFLRRRLSAKALHARHLSRRLALDLCGVRLTAEASKKRRFGVQIAPNRAWRAPYEEASALDSGKTQENRREKRKERARAHGRNRRTQRERELARGRNRAQREQARGGA